jgi:hypothetical protein
MEFSGRRKQRGNVDGQKKQSGKSKPEGFLLIFVPNKKQQGRMQKHQSISANSAEENAGKTQLFPAGNLLFRNILLSLFLVRRTLYIL